MRLKNQAEKPNLAVNLGGVKLKNPVVVASGTFGYGKEYESFIDLSKIGAVIVKGTTIEPRLGNPPPRIIETPAGMLNAIGLENPGIEVFLTEYLPYLLDKGATVIVNIAGNTIEDYAKLADRIENHHGIAAIELNISCPNVKQGGLQFGTKPDSVYEVVKAVKAHTSRPIIPKLSPNVTDIVEIAMAAKSAGADGLSMINTLLGMAVDVKNNRPALGNVFGGLSGPAIKPVALRMIYQVYKAIDLPILGGGGILDTNDALEFLMVGSSAVSIGTGNFINPYAALEIIDGLQNYLSEHNLVHISQVTGMAVI